MRGNNFPVEQPAPSIQHHLRLRMNLKTYLATRRRWVDHALDHFLPKESAPPPTIHKAMRYSLFAGGKRLRPILTLAAAEACGGKPRTALPLACAMECIHTYSLVHDDLPSMDNDDFRRGRATCHRVFGDGIAVLAGDALLTIAFEIAARAKPTRHYSVAEFLREMASAAGSRKLIAGQVADLEAEGTKATREQLRYIHENKTAAMITTSVCLGAMSANADAKRLGAITRFGRNLGLAFQVIDDILDVTQTGHLSRDHRIGRFASGSEATDKSCATRTLNLRKRSAAAPRNRELSPGTRILGLWVAHASRGLATASSPSRTFLKMQRTKVWPRPKQRLFRRDAETSTRDACATRNVRAQGSDRFLRSIPR
jgi:geranylgeranyl diphosphate synthase type II